MSLLKAWPDFAWTDLRFLFWSNSGSDHLKVRFSMKADASPFENERLSCIERGLYPRVLSRLAPHARSGL